MNNIETTSKIRASLCTIYGFKSTNSKTAKDEELRFSSRLVDHEARDLSTSHDEVDYLGCGSFGYVRVCYHPTLGMVVVKCFGLTGDKDTVKNRIKSVKREANILARLRDHEHIVKIHGVTSWSNNVGIILEYLDGGNLDSYLKNEAVPTISWPTRLKFAFQLILALEYLHNYEPGKAFCHGDVKPENLLLTKNHDIKLSDFGAANILRATGLQTTTLDAPPTKQHTLFYAAPEFLLHYCDATPSMDIYSYSMVLYEIITRRTVYETCSISFNVLRTLIASDRNIRPTLNLVDEAEVRIRNPNDLQIFYCLKRIMVACWNGEPDERCTSSQVAETLKGFQRTSLSQISGIQVRVSRIHTEGRSGKVGLHMFESPFRVANVASSQFTGSVQNSSVFAYERDTASSGLVYAYSTRTTSRLRRFLTVILPTRWVQPRKHESYFFTAKMGPGDHEFAHGGRLLYSYKGSFAHGTLFSIVTAPINGAKKVEGVIRRINLRNNDDELFGPRKAQNVLGAALPSANRLKLNKHQDLCQFDEPEAQATSADFALIHGSWQYPSVGMLNENGVTLKLWKSKLPKEPHHGILIGTDERELEEFAMIAGRFFGAECLVWIRYSLQSDAHNGDNEYILLP